MTMEGMVQSEKAVKDSGVIDTRTQAAGTQILVIEDDPHMQKVLQRIFREQGYAVIECGDGQAGLDAFRSGTPSAVILDLLLPNIRWAPSAMRMPSSRSRLLTEYAASPKIPVIASMAPIMPSAPSATVATREGNSAMDNASGHVWTWKGRPASISRKSLRMAAASCCGSRSERTTRDVMLDGDCRMDTNIAGFWSSVS